MPYSAITLIFGWKFDRKTQWKIEKLCICEFYIKQINSKGLNANFFSNTKKPD